MIIRKKGQKPLGLNEPLRHPDHRRPVTRRDFLSQGFITGAATILVPSLFGSMVAARKAGATVLSDLDPQGLCNISIGAGKIPFICFDLSGGANIAGSNVLVGQRNGQLDLLSTAGYSKLGLPGNMTPASSTTNFVNTEFGLAFHSDSAFLRGMQSTTSVGTRALVHGAVIPARSENDTGNNQHNPMYGIAIAGADGQLLTLIGSENSDSGGNSAAPVAYMNPAIRPTKIDRPSDSTGLVGGSDQLPSVLSQTDTVSVLKAVERVSKLQLNGSTDTLTADDAAIKKMVDCQYVKSAYMTEQFGPTALNPAADTDVTAIFSTLGGITADSEYAKTASVMKLVVDGRAGAGTIQMGGFDYHTGDRSTGEARDFRAGQCMGACLEYAAKKGKPLMLYVFSDGSLNSNGMIDNSVGGRGKGQWTGDNQSTACSFFLVLNPSGKAVPHNALTTAGGPQIGNFQSSGDVNTSSSPAANAVNLLVDTVLLNYMALHGEQGNFATKFPNSGLNAAGSLDGLIAFNMLSGIVNGKIS